MFFVTAKVSKDSSPTCDNCITTLVPANTFRLFFLMFSQFAGALHKLS